MSQSPQVLLFRPPVREFSDSPFQWATGPGRSYPIGLAYLAGALRQEGIGVEILDAWAYPGAERSPLPRELGYLRGLSDLRYSWHSADFFHQGMPAKRIRDFLRRGNFPIVGVSSMFSGYHLDALTWADEIKKILPKAVVILGGSATTASAEMTLSHSSVDFVVLGEAETSFPKLARAILNGDSVTIREIHGVGFKESGALRLRPRGDFIPDPDSLPRPAHDLVNHSYYRLGASRSPYAGLFTSRGCPHLCDFCTIYISMGRKFRVHSPERVLEDIRHCRDNYGTRVFYIEDDNFAFDPERAKAILRLVIREFGAKKLVFRDFNGMTALSLRDKELVSLMAQAGFDMVWIALESEDADVRRIMKKPGSVAHFSEAVRNCAQAGIYVGAFTIIGLPYSTLAKDIQTQLFCLTQPCAATPILYYPIPTTPQYDYCVKQGWVRPEPRFMPRLRSETFVASRPGYSRREAFTLINLAKLFGRFKLAARSLLSEGEQVPFRELASRRHKSHPCRVKKGANDEIAIIRDGLEDTDILFFQIDSLLRYGELAGVVARDGNQARLKPAKPSRKVVSSFLSGLPAHPLRYASGGEVPFS